MQELAPKAWQYGVLGIVACVFAYAIVHLFRALQAAYERNAAAEKAREAERSDWTKRELLLRQELETKEADLRAEYERKHREVIDHYAQLAKAERRENREHEDKAREEFAEIMEKVSADANKSTDALVNMLQKFYERFVGPGRHGPRY